MLPRPDISAIALPSFNEAPPEARLTLYTPRPSAGTMSPSFTMPAIPRGRRLVTLTERGDAGAMVLYAIVATRRGRFSTLSMVRPAKFHGKILNSS